MADWKELEQRCMQCDRCPLAPTRTNVVFGAGQTDAEVMFVGEGPGEHEDLQGEPFVGKAGQLLDDMLSLIGLSRKSNFYIANIVKCRPPGNRDPLNVEQEACIGYLRRQTALLAPKIIICLGRVAAMRLMSEKFKISKEHGTWIERGGVRFTAIYHPAALLRDPGRLPETFEDLKAIKAEIERICTETKLDDPWKRQH